MRSHLRTLIVLALAAALLGLVLYNVDLRGVAREIVHARFDWLMLSLLTMFANLAIRAWRWQYLLEPLGPTSFANAFRATAVVSRRRAFFQRARERSFALTFSRDMNA